MERWMKMLDRLGFQRLTALVLALMASSIISPLKARGQQYSDLSPAQQALIGAYCRTKPCQAALYWKDTLVDSQRLEFAGGTQALDKAKLKDQSSGLSKLSAILDKPAPPAGPPPPSEPPVVGSVPTEKSQYQFHINAGWSAEAAKAFKNSGWDCHLTWFHPGQFGYQQDIDWPSSGLIVLFDLAPKTTGQFHIDFRFWRHFGADNGNVAANYVTYQDWYLAIPGYTPPGTIGPSTRVGTMTFSNAAETRNLAVERVRESTALPGADLAETVRGFLKAWYVDRDINSLQKFLAPDNMLSYGEHKNAAAPEEWNEIFLEPFQVNHGRLPHPDNIGQVITYHAPSMPPENAPLRYLNQDARGQVAAPFAIVDMRSIPPGSLLPSPNAQQGRTELGRFFSSVLPNLPPLDEHGAGNLAIVIYLTTEASGLEQTAAVTYWTRAGGTWKLAAYHDAD